MTIPILATKLFIPPPPADFIQRPMLLEKLESGSSRKVTLVSAPAGYGKTTTIAAWLKPSGSSQSTSTANHKPVAWLALDENDNELTRFLSYFLAALQQTGAMPAQLEQLQQLAQSPERPAIENLLTDLINLLAAIPEHVVCVLDDYHLIENQGIHDALTFLIENLPPQLHLVLTTREDPPLPFFRWRARGAVNELRSSDLRFTQDEASQFFNRVLGLSLSSEEIALLETRTEGWVTGLQLVALTLKGRKETAEEIRQFAGDNRYIMDYLIGEVLKQQSEAVRQFLLQTSILERLYGPLCEAVTGLPDGNGLLECLDRENLFLIPLDQKRQWFRYHHLFADVLHAHLMVEQPDQLGRLHQRASLWFHENGFTENAVRHALESGDDAHAADLIEKAWPEMDGRFQEGLWMKWAKALPEAVIRSHPVINVAYGWALLNDGEMEAGETRLQDAESCLNLPAERRDEFTVVDPLQYENLPASIATARAYIAQASGDVPATMRYGRQALDLLPEDDYLRRGPSAALLGLACWGNGDLEEAHRFLLESMDGFKKAGSNNFAISITYGLADIRTVQGCLQDGIQIYQQSLQFALAQGQPTLRGTSDIYLGLGQLNLESGQRELAGEFLRKSEELGQEFALQDYQYRHPIIKARFMEVDGELAQALALLDKAERLYFRTPVPNLRPIGAQRARLWLRQGQFDLAAGWAREQNLAVEDELTFLHEYEHVTLTRILLDRYRQSGQQTGLEDARLLLARLLQAAEAGGRDGSAIEILILQALVLDALEQPDASRASLERALDLAAPQGFFQVFLDEGPALAHLLLGLLPTGHQHAYVEKLLAAFPPVEHPASTASPNQGGLIEALSERELEVLALIAQGLSNQAIADQLYISLHTVKVHARRIYAKLAVDNRTQAVVRGKSLGILPPD